MTPPASDEACLDVPIPRCEKRTAERAMRQELRRHLDEEQAIELVLLVGHYQMLATAISTLRIETDEPRRRA